jgi:hypothetical protein
VAQFTQAGLDALDKAIQTGARSISYDGKTTVFRDLSEMQALRERMAHNLAGTVGTGAGLTQFSKGL